jgi:outer membrane protein
MILTLLLALGAGAFEPPREPLSLADALERAAACNPGLRAMRERLAAADSRAVAIRKSRLPRIGVELNADRTDSPAAIFAHKLNAGQLAASDFDPTRLNSPDPIYHLGSGVYLDAPIDLSGRVGLASRAQVEDQKAGEENLREAEADLGLRVAEAYWSAVVAKRGALVSEKAVAAARSRELASEARFTEGLALQSDVLRLRARRRAREADLAGRRADFAVLESLLARLIGAGEGSRFDLVDSPAPVSAIEPLESWKSRAEARPILAAARHRREAAATAVRFEERSSRPELAVQGRLTDDRTPQGGGASWAVGAVVRWAFVDPTRGRRLSAARADERAVDNEQRSAADEVRFEVETTFSRLVAARDRLQAAEGGAEEGREALRVIQERRSQGLATLTDELETEAAAFTAELEEIDAARSAALARAALERAAGVPLWRKPE